MVARCIRAYLDLLQGLAPTQDSKPRYTYRRPSDQEVERRAAGTYWRDVAALERRLRSVPRQGGVDLPAGVGGALAESLMPVLAGQAHAFRSSGPRRHAVYNRVLEEVPDSGRLVIAAHSLGSVVLADLVYHLPPGLEVDLILTLGSPLGLGPLRKHLQRLRDDFPFSTVGAWLNVAGIADPVTGFRGLASSFPEALDVFVDTGLAGAHDAAAAAASAPSAPARSAAAAAPAPQPDVFEQLRKLGELRDSGVVTTEEFDLKKAELLARL